MTSWPPQPKVHDPACSAAHGQTMARSAVMKQWREPRPHHCVPPWGRAGDQLVVEPYVEDGHDYEACMIWPWGASRALCRHCHGTHDDRPQEVREAAGLEEQRRGKSHGQP